MSPEATFDRLFAQYREPVQRYCLRRLGVDEADDAAAEVFLVAWRRIDDIPLGMELPWLYGVARNVVRNQHRTQGRLFQLRDRMASQPHVDGPDPEVVVLRRDEDVAVLRALAVLRSEEQEILRLKAWERLSNGEIAAVLGTSVGAVDMRLTRARKHLAAAYQANERRATAFVRKDHTSSGGGE
jgi:RNA polymerase sigma-70 factor, ECF subfamily